MLWNETVACLRNDTYVRFGGGGGLVLGLSIPICKWGGEQGDFLQHFELSYSAILQSVTCSERSCNT